VIRYSETNPVQSYLAISKNPLEFLSHVQKTSGDFAEFRILGFRYCLVNEPQLIKEALVEKSDAFVIQGGASKGLARLIGNGILTNRGKNWKHSRQSLLPHFQQSAMEHWHSAIQSCVAESLARWKENFSDEPFLLNRELLALSFRIKCSTLFNSVSTFEEAEEFADAIWTLQLDGMIRYTNGIDFVPWLPLPLNRRVNSAVRTLSRIARRLETPEFPADEIRSLLFAGAESPANTICWALLLLSRNPEWIDRLFNQPPGHRRDSETDVLAQILNEVMRLYPAGWAFERYAPQEFPLGGRTIRKRTRLMFSPFLLHRNSRHWPEPEKFDPSRFARGTALSSGIPAFSFLPFGAGPRSCIGSRLAVSEMRTVLSAILNEVRLQIVSPPPEPRGSFKIRLSQPLVVKMESQIDRRPQPSPVPNTETNSV